MPALRIGVWALVLVSANPWKAFGQTASSQSGASVTIRYSIKTSGLFARLPDDSGLFPDRETATGFERFRLEPTVRLGDVVSFDVAFEQHARVFSSETDATSGGVLPRETNAPFRVRQLDWTFGSSSHAEWRGEIDRAALRVHFDRADVSIGRQAIGWGRGVMFGAVDLFAPFAPLEADREWRRGVDLARVDVKLGDRTSFDLVGAFGDTRDRSAFAARVRGYAGKADIELLGGWRARDVFGGITSSAPLGDAEMHGELAIFRTAAVSDSIAFSAERSIAKAVLGASYQFAIGHGLTTSAEYHYSGFGATSPDRILILLSDPAFQERYLRGDTQILGRHAAAGAVSYEYSPETTVAAQWLQSPSDRSGVVLPSVTATISDHVSLTLTAYLPYGREPIGQTLATEFGAAPLAAFFQLRVYR